MEDAGKLPSERVLRRRIDELFGNAIPSLKEIVDCLIVAFPEYSRQCPEAFTGMVKQTLDSGKQKSTRKDEDDGQPIIIDDDDDDEDATSPVSKKAKKIVSKKPRLATKRKTIQQQSASEPAFDLTKQKNLSVADSYGLMNGKDDRPRFKDLGGMDGVLDELKMEVLVPLFNPHLLQSFGIKPTSGILLHGPPGCGKTKLAQAIANETGVPFYMKSAIELLSEKGGESEKNIRELFSTAYINAPSIVFIDEIDAIASKIEDLSQYYRRIVTQLLTCMDESHNASKSKKGHVLVIGATNRPDALDPAIRRPGRFDREIMLGVPDEKGRLQILSVLARKLKLEGGIDLVRISKATPGFVGADLGELMKKACKLAVKRILDGKKLDPSGTQDWWRKEWTPQEMEGLSITMSDFEVASKLVQPSSRREGFSSIPNVKWEDVGGFEMLRREFDRYIIRRIKYPAKYEEYGFDVDPGYLLYGPPGCGKTLIGKAVANEAGANFIYIKGPELLNKWMGESELAVRRVFNRARACSPCILFFDEVDALTPKRRSDGESQVRERVLNQLLLELDGADQRKGVYVIGATNRPEIMDPAVLRPGRFGKLMYVPLPNQEERGLILKALGRKKPLDADVDLITIGQSKACANLSGADLSALMEEAAMAAIEEEFTRSEAAALEGISSPSSLKPTIKTLHFVQALRKISPSVSDKQKEHFHRLSQSFKPT